MSLYLIGEIGINHNGDMDIAKKIAEKYVDLTTNKDEKLKPNNGNLKKIMDLCKQLEEEEMKDA